MYDCRCTNMWFPCIYSIHAFTIRFYALNRLPCRFLFLIIHIMAMVCLVNIPERKPNFRAVMGCQLPFVLYPHWLNSWTNMKNMNSSLPISPGKELEKKAIKPSSVVCVWTSTKSSVQMRQPCLLFGSSIRHFILHIVYSSWDSLLSLSLSISLPLS